MSSRLLVLEPRRLGDAIMSIPFVRAALLKHEVWICCSSDGRPAYDAWVPSERIVVWDAPWQSESGASFSQSLRSISQIGRRLRREKPGLAVSVWADPRIHWILKKSGARCRIGFPMRYKNFYAHHLGWRRRQLLAGKVFSMAASLLSGGPLLTKKINRADYLQHHVEHWRQLCDALDLTWNDAPPWLPVSRELIPKELEDFSAKTRGEGAPLWLVHPGARAANRRWPWSGFEAVIRQTLLPAGAGVIVIEPPEMGPIDLAHPQVFVGRPSSAAEFFQWVGLADRVLCNDTSAAHLAAALGKKAVALYSANLPEWFAPYRQMERTVSSTNCPYKPCFDRCLMQRFICLEGIAVEAVKEKVTELLG